MYGVERGKRWRLLQSLTYRYLKELVYQFRKIGTNINQATKQLHIGYEPAAAADRLEKNMKLLEQQFEKMKEELKQTYGNHEDIKH
jgi:hypothetical protein